MTPFLFASPDGRRSSSSARRVHLRRLYDILHLSIQRGDLLLAQKSFALLSRCEDVEWAAIWKFGLIVLATAGQPPPGHVNNNNMLLGTPKHVEFLRVMMLRHPEEVRTHSLSFPGLQFLSFPSPPLSSVSSPPLAPAPKQLYSPKSSLANSPSFHSFDSANRSCGSWYCRWLWLDGSATPSTNSSCADLYVFFLHTTTRQPTLAI
jgi:hypothetical protein